MITYTSAALCGFILLAVYYTAMALIGAMEPPLPGEERTRYAYWFRVAQLLAANIQRAAEHRFGPDFAATTHIDRTAVAVETASAAATGNSVVAAIAEHTEVTAVATDGK